MGMVNLKQDKKEMEKGTEVTASPEAPKDEYPYGLRVTLDQDTLKKLGISDAIGDYDIDDTVTISAKCLVKSVSKSKDDYGKENESERMELQITDLSIEKGGEESDEDELNWDEGRNSADKKLKDKGY